MRSADLVLGLLDPDRGGLEGKVTVGRSGGQGGGLRFMVDVDKLPFLLAFDGGRLLSLGGDFGGTLGGISIGLSTGVCNTGPAVVGVVVGDRIGDNGRVVLKVAGDTSATGAGQGVIPDA